MNKHVMRYIFDNQSITVALCGKRNEPMLNKLAQNGVTCPQCKDLCNKYRGTQL